MSWIEMVADWESALIKELQQKADALRSKASLGGGSSMRMWLASSTT